jgi:hypothetical protein
VRGRIDVSAEIRPGLMRASYSHGENKCASPYIGERFCENGVGGKWLMGGLLRIPLTLMGHGDGAVGG